jgi:PKD repeat protein
MKAPHWRTVAVILVGALGAAACSDDSTQPGNTAPVANFTSSCTDLVCTFTDLSSDADGTVANLAWDFGDDGSGSGAAPQHTYAAAGDYLVTLTAKDNDDAETSKAQHVIVTAAVGSNPPTADFTVVCSSLDCTFTDASTPTGAAVTWDWDFGDGSAHSALQAPPVHTYVASGVATYTAKLTITDASSNSSTKSTQFTVSPAATLQCADAANPNQFASCTLKLLANATVRVTLTSRECTAHGNSFQITAPITATLFTDGCYTPAEGTSFDLNGGAQFAANTELEAQVISGSTKQEVAPALHVEGTYPTWTLRFDDGEDNSPPEPDFNDLVITVTATPAP